MSTSVSALCRLLVSNHFGELAAQVFETLTTYGRLNFPTLIQHSGILPRYVRHGLAILVQQNLVVWTADQVDNIWYEAHAQNAYNLVRQGKLSRVVGERFDTVGQSVVTTLILSGPARIADILDAFVADKQKEDRKKVAKVNGEQAESDTAETDHDQTNGEHVNGSTEAPLELHNDEQRDVDETTVPFDSDEYKNSVRNTVLALIDQGYLTVAHDSHFRPLADIQNDAREVELKIHGEKVKKVDEFAFGEKMKTRMINWKYNETARQEIIANTGLREVKIGKRRRLADEELEDAGNGAKRRRLDDLGANSRLKLTYHTASQERLASLDNYVVKINYDKLNVVCRNEQLLNLAKDRIGQVTSLVYEEVLDRLTRTMPYCQGLSDPDLQGRLRTTDVDDNPVIEDPPTVSTEHVQAAIDLDSCGPGIGSTVRAKKTNTNGSQASNPVRAENEINGHGEGQEDTSKKLTNGHVNDADDEEALQSTAAKRRKRKAAPVKSELDPADIAEADDYVLGIVDDDPGNVHRSHLLLLRESSPFSFVKLHQKTHRTVEGWSVDFVRANRELRMFLMLDMIRTRFSSESLRLVTLLHERGKLEQQQMEKASLLNKKQVMGALTAMHTAGILDLQEVPRDSTRAPIKTIYLWYFDEARARTKFIEDAYKTMLRTLERVKIEREKHQSIITKSQRTDVQENEEALLTQAEQRKLRAHRENEMQLMVQIERCDDIIFCLRDF